MPALVRETASTGGEEEGGGSSCVVDFDRDTIHTDFLLTALEELLLDRSLLRNSYAWAFYNIVGGPSGQPASSKVNLWGKVLTPLFYHLPKSDATTLRVKLKQDFEKQQGVFFLPCFLPSLPSLLTTYLLLTYLLTTLTYLLILGLFQSATERLSDVIARRRIHVSRSEIISAVNAARVERVKFQEQLR